MKMIRMENLTLGHQAEVEVHSCVRNEKKARGKNEDFKV